MITSTICGILSLSLFFIFRSWHDNLKKVNQNLDIKYYKIFFFENFNAHIYLIIFSREFVLIIEDIKDSFIGTVYKYL